MLQVVKEIREKGLESVVAEYSLRLKEYPNYILLKYNQFKSDLSKRVCQECRGLILDRQTYEPLAMGYHKFFNLGEPNAHQFNFQNYKCAQKHDGSLITLWYDPYSQQWKTATVNDALGEGAVDRLSPYSNYYQLFTKCFKNANHNALNTEYCYNFELQTPWNIVVTPHQEYSLVLLSARKVSLINNDNYGHRFGEVDDSELEVFSKSLNISLPQYYIFHTLEELKQSLADKPEEFEGYVIRDDFYRRLKIKNSKYLDAHYNKNSVTSESMINAVCAGEYDEYRTTLSRPDILAKLDLIQKIWKNLLTELNNIITQIGTDKINLIRQNRALRKDLIHQLKNYKYIDWVWKHIDYNQTAEEYIQNLPIKTKKLIFEIEDDIFDSNK